jgi:hypothetical protein
MTDIFPVVLCEGNEMDSTMSYFTSILYLRIKAGCWISAIMNIGHEFPDSITERSNEEWTRIFENFVDFNDWYRVSSYESAKVKLSLKL